MTPLLASSRALAALLTIGFLAAPAFGQDRAEIDATKIIGNRDLPKVLYIVPWKKPLPGDLAGRPPVSVACTIWQMLTVSRSGLTQRSGSSTSFFSALPAFVPLSASDVVVRCGGLLVSGWRYCRDRRREPSPVAGGWSGRLPSRQLSIWSTESGR